VLALAGELPAGFAGSTPRARAVWVGFGAWVLERACGCPVLGLCFDFWPVAGAGRASVPASLWRRTVAKFDGLASVLIFRVFRKGGF